jgi:quercetin dioxygenase-like cupin family protein
MRVDWSSVPTTRGLRPGSERKAVAGELLSVVKVATAPDAEFDRRLHRHPHEQLLVMVGGLVTLQIEHDVFEVGAGELVLIPRGSWHGAVGVGPDGCDYYEVFAPPRVDYLPGYIGRSPLEFIDADDLPRPG